jgi:acyl carrier protein
MLALEDEFDVEFPDEDLKKATFATVSNLEAVVSKLLAGVA